MDSKLGTKSAEQPKADVKSRSMVELTGGKFIMGSDLHYREEAPARECLVEAFQLDVCAVTNQEFAEFISATNYVTTAEKIPDRIDCPDMPDEFFRAGSLVFFMPDKPVPLDEPRNWWRFVEAACWRHPEGPLSDLNGRESHPVVHVPYLDAFEFACWAGKSLPTEAEWEYAAVAGSQENVVFDGALLILGPAHFRIITSKVLTHPLLFQ